MTRPAPMAEIHRGDFLESVHAGHAVAVSASGEVIEAWGDPDAVVLPRSSVKMIQALPLVEGGGATEIPPRRLALACSSHSGERMHTNEVTRWLDEMGLGEDDLACGPEPVRYLPQLHEDIRAGREPSRVADQCSGKHAGFLALARHLGTDPADYARPDGAVQGLVRATFEEVTGAPSPGYAMDGCRAPNFAATLTAIGRGMAAFAAARDDAGDARSRAMARLRDAMIAHPEMVAGTGRACTALMRAARGRAAVKTGAEGVYVAILPERRIGLALKIADGATRAAELAIAALLVRFGALDARDPAVRAWIARPLRDRRGGEVGMERPASGLLPQAKSSRV